MKTNDELIALQEQVRAKTLAEETALVQTSGDALIDELEEIIVESPWSMDDKYWRALMILEHLRSRVISTE